MITNSWERYWSQMLIIDKQCTDTSKLGDKSIGIPSDVYAFEAVSLVVFGKKKNSLARGLHLPNHVPSPCFKCIANTSF